MSTIQVVGNRIAGVFEIYAPRVLWMILILCFFWAISFLVRRIILHIGRWTKANAVVLDLVLQVFRIAIWIFAIITALGALGIDVSALIAGVGIVGFAIGFAFKDVLSNVLSGLMLLYFRPFWIDDKVRVAGQLGIVTDIDLRYTTLDAEGKQVLIPNSTLFTNTVELLSRNPDPKNENLLRQESEGKS